MSMNRSLRNLVENLSEEAASGGFDPIDADRIDREIKNYTKDRVDRLGYPKSKPVLFAVEVFNKIDPKAQTSFSDKEWEMTSQKRAVNLYLKQVEKIDKKGRVKLSAIYDGRKAYEVIVASDSIL